VPIQTHTLPPTIPFTPGIGNGFTLERPEDGMIMLYVPAGAFEMGSTRTMRLYAKRLCEQYSGDLAFGTCSLSAFANESPAHTVALEAFWIDRTEVTNVQYRQCVEAGACTPPEEHSSYTRVHYFDDTAFDEYPVIWVNWHMGRGAPAGRGGVGVRRTRTRQSDLPVGERVRTGTTELL
jgi:formylglycine-generating enzyme required for sulfatase activity